MILNEQQRTELLEAAKPLLAWMNANCHPHCTAHVDQASVEVTEGVCHLVTYEFVKD